MGKCLIIVDPQNDFLEGGSLPVNEAKEIMGDLAMYISKYGHEYSHIFITCDNHPFNHCSFKENGGEWPTHCVNHTVGAAIYQPIAESLIPFKDMVTFLPKGENAKVEEYSAFPSTNQFNIDELTHIIERKNIDRIDICGIAGDICVLNTIKGLIELGHKSKIFVIDEFCPSIDDGTTLHEFYKESGVMHSLI